MAVSMVGGPGRTDDRVDGRGHGQLGPYPLAVRPLAAVPPVAPVVDLRGVAGRLVDATGPWDDALAYLDTFVRTTGNVGPEAAVVEETIKRHDSRRGADAGQLAAVLAALDDGRPVAFYGWWPTEAAAATSGILGVDAVDVPPPDRKWAGLVHGHAVVIVGYGRHAAFPGGGYVIVRTSWGPSGWGDEGDGYLPFTYLRTYATELRTCRLVDGPGRRTDGGGPSAADRPAGGSPRLPGVAPRDQVDVAIDRQARCADPRAALTHLFFSEDILELARARAICSTCAVRQACLARALERREPYGIWGGHMVIDGELVPDKRGRGRPPKVPRPRLVVDEITGVPIVA
jgi:hypothetical protein